MFPDSPFAVPRGSFQRPVPLVLVDPCSNPTVTVKINREWIPYILGALQQLVLQATWDTTDPDALWLVQQRAMLLLSCVAQTLDGSNDDNCCEVWPLASDIIDWAPINPYTDPTTVPAGYRFPPWYVIGGSIPFTGLQAGDIVTDLLHGPIVEPISSGFPRFRIHCKGAGQVQIMFVRFPTAGTALITIDDNISSARFVDLHTSLAASIGAPEAEMIIPVAVSGEGDHHVDVTMVYSITEDPPFVHFGGGIRQISLCGFGSKPEPQTFAIAEWVEEMCLKCNIRIHDGKIQVLDCGEWVDIDGQSEGFIPSGSTQPSSGSRPAAGQSQCSKRSMTARGTYLVPFGVKNGDIVTVSARNGAWSNDGVRWTCTDGTPFSFGLCSGSRYHDAADPDPTTLYHGQLMLVVGGQMISATDGPVTLSGLSGQQQLIVAPNFTPGLFAGGDIEYTICVENGEAPPVGTWCFNMEFAGSDYGFVTTPGVIGDGGAWTPGSGWVGTDWEYATAQYYRGVDVTLTIAATDFDSLTLEYDLSGLVVNPGTEGNPCAAVLLNNVPYGAVTFGAQTDGTGKLIVATGPIAAVTTIRIFILTCYGTLVRGGAVTVRRMTVNGSSTNPFGSSNC